MDNASSSSSPLPHGSHGAASIAPDALYRVLGGPHCPLIVDVRKAPAFGAYVRNPSFCSI